MAHDSAISPLMFNHRPTDTILSLCRSFCHSVLRLSTGVTLPSAVDPGHRVTETSPVVPPGNQVTTVDVGHAARGSHVADAAEAVHGRDPLVRDLLRGVASRADPLERTACPADARVLRVAPVAGDRDEPAHRLAVHLQGGDQGATHVLAGSLDALASDATARAVHAAALAAELAEREVGAEGAATGLAVALGPQEGLSGERADEAVHLERGAQGPEALEVTNGLLVARRRVGAEAQPVEDGLRLRGVDSGLDTLHRAVAARLLSGLSQEGRDVLQALGSLGLVVDVVRGVGLVLTGHLDIGGQVVDGGVLRLVLGLRRGAAVLVENDLRVVELGQVEHPIVVTVVRCFEHLDLRLRGVTHLVPPGGCGLTSSMTHAWVRTSLLLSSSRCVGLSNQFETGSLTRSLRGRDNDRGDRSHAHTAQLLLHVLDGLLLLLDDVVRFFHVRVGLCLVDDELRFQLTDPGLESLDQRVDVQFSHGARTPRSLAWCRRGTSQFSRSA